MFPLPLLPNAPSARGGLIHSEARSRRFVHRLTNSALSAISWLHDSSGHEQSSPVAPQTPDDLQREAQAHIGRQCRQFASELDDISSAGVVDESLHAMLNRRSLYNAEGSRNLAGFVASRMAAPSSSVDSPELLKVGPIDVRQYLESPNEAMLVEDLPE